MRLRTSLLIAMLAAGALVDVRGTDGQARRRDPPGQATLDPMDIVSDPNSELAVTLKREYEQADLAISNYVLQGMLSAQQGHRLAFSKFRVWFRETKEAKKAAATSVAQELVKQLLPVAFNVIFPGAKELVGTLTKLTSGTIAVGGKMLDIPEGNVDLFLDRLQAAEEERIALLLDLPAQLKKERANEIAAAKLEYLELRLHEPQTDEERRAREADRARDPQGAQLPQSVIDILDAIGVPKPGQQTSTRVAEGVLENHIYTVMTSDPDWDRINWPYSSHQYAKVHALRMLDPVANKARMCEAQQSWTYYRTIDRKECDELLNR
jgi:hypothetical protein